MRGCAWHRALSQNRPGRARCRTPGPWPCARYPGCTLQQKHSRPSARGRQGETGEGREVYAALTASSRLGAALQEEREPQFEKQEEEGDR